MTPAINILVGASFIASGAFALPGVLPSGTPVSSSISSAASTPHSTPSGLHGVSLLRKSASSARASVPSRISVSSSTSSSTSTPRPSPSDEPKVPKICTADDEKIWTRDNWQKEGRDMAEWYSNWRKKNFRDDDHLDERFSSYWGLGPSFSCEIDNMCKVPRCSDLNRPEQAQDYENAAMFLASMANFNNHYGRIYDVLDGVKTDFGAIQSVLQQSFYPGIKPADVKSIQGMNGGLATIGLISAWSGPASPFLNTGKEIFGGVSRGLNAILIAADKNIKHMSEMASLFTEKIDKIRGEFANLHDAIIEDGKTESISIAAIFKDGSYVDKREIAILHDVAVEDLRTYVRNILFANIVNNAWIKQGAYIFSRKLKKEDCEKYKRTIGENTPPHLCHNDRIYFLNQYLGATFEHTCGVSAVAGWKDLEKEVGATVHDAMRSSIDAFEKGGYKYDSADYTDNIFEGNVREKIDLGSRYQGVWTIPVCEVESSSQFEDIKIDKDTSLYWSTVDKNHPDEGKGQNGVQMCLCAQAKDHNDVSIKDLPNVGSSSFRAVLDAKEHQSCDLGKKGLGFSG